MKPSKFIFFSVFIFSLFFNCTQKDNKNFNISIVSIVEIDPIVQLRKGFRKVITNSEFAKSHVINIEEYNAQNDPSITNQIVDKLVTNPPDLIYVLGTPIAQAIQKRLPNVLLVQGTATDPVAAGLADSWAGSGRNYIATTDLPPIKKQVELILGLTPNVQKLGVIYNPGETNSVAVISRLREYLDSNKSQIKLVERPISNTSEVSTAVQSLFGNVDAVYLPPDNTAHAAIPVIGLFTNENKIPFYATVTSAIDDGAIATLSLDFYVLGEETARLALRVLNGEEAGKIPIIPIENPLITINGKLVKEYSLNIDQFKNRDNVKIVE